MFLWQTFSQNSVLVFGLFYPSHCIYSLWAMSFLCNNSLVYLFVHLFIDWFIGELIHLLIVWLKQVLCQLIYLLVVYNLINWFGHWLTLCTLNIHILTYLYSLIYLFVNFLFIYLLLYWSVETGALWVLPSAASHTCRACVHLARRLSQYDDDKNNDTVISDWLQQARNGSLSAGTQPPSSVLLTHLVASIFLTHDDHSTLDSCLRLLQAICLADKPQVYI